MNVVRIENYREWQFVCVKNRKSEIERYYFVNGK